MNKVESKEKRRYYLFDCNDYVLGRLSAKVAFILQGKNSPDYSPNAETDNWAVAINSAKIQITGNKAEQKTYHHFSGYPGGITSKKLKDLMKDDPNSVIRKSVYGMLPKNKLRDKMMKRLIILKNDAHNLDVKFEE
jgi:large subunit ribosomal protein L13